MHHFHQKKLNDDQFLITENIKLNHPKFYHAYRSRYHVANKSEFLESNYDVYHFQSWLLLWQYHFWVYWDRVLPKQNVFWGRLCAEKDLWTSWRKWLSLSVMQLHLSGAQFPFWKGNIIVMLDVWPKEVCFCRDTKNKRRQNWSCPIVLAWILLEEKVSTSKHVK